VGDPAFHLVVTGMLAILTRQPFFAVGGIDESQNQVESLANRINGIEGNHGTGSGEDAGDHQEPSWYQAFRTQSPLEETAV
jgi:hypothetical protein